MADQYGVCETALQTILEGVSGLGSGKVTLSDYSPFENGVTQFIVLQPDSFDSGDQSWGMDFKNWNILLELYQRFTHEAQTMTNFRTLRSNVINQLDKYPTLNGADGVVGISISSDGGVQDVTERSDPSIIYYRLQIIRVVIRQQVDNISGGEYT